MKKITFILFAFIGAAAFAQDDANANATVNAEIVMPISIENDRGLNFGRLIGTAGTATIAHTVAGERTGTDAVLAAIGETSAEPQSGMFTIKAAADYQYSVALSNLENLQSGTGDDADLLPISFTHNLAAADNQGSGTTGIPLYLGGTVTVSDNQAEGDYSGEITVTVTYE